MRKKCSVSSILFYTSVFATFIVFYFQVHPLVPFDMDDWANMSLARPGYPTISDDVFNPTKIFPEVLQVLTGLLGAYVITPLLGDYVTSLILANAIVLSLFIILFLYSVQRYIESRYSLSRPLVFCCIILFTLFHFLAFRIHPSNNEYLWFAPDCTCFFHYVISDLFCISLLLWLIRMKPTEPQGDLKLSILVLGGYLALCSNLYSSVIIIAFVGAILCSQLVNHFRSKKCLKDFAYKNRYLLIIIFLWLTVQLFEVNGNRASYSTSENSLITNIWITIKILAHKRLNHVFIGGSILLLISSMAIRIRTSNKKLDYLRSHNQILLLAGILSALYLILLSAKVGPEYINRPGVIYSFLIFFLLLVLNSICYLCSQVRWFKIMLPLLTFITLFEINTSEKTFLDVQYESNLNVQSCIRTSQHIVREAYYGALRGEDEILIDVPKFEEQKNWPLSVKHSCFLGRTLNKHGITNRPIDTYFNPKE